MEVAVIDGWRGATSRGPAPPPLELGAASSGFVQLLEPVPEGTSCVVGSFPACSFLIDGRLTGRGTESLAPATALGRLLSTSMPLKPTFAPPKPAAGCPPEVLLFVSTLLRLLLAYFAPPALFFD